MSKEPHDTRGCEWRPLPALERPRPLDETRTPEQWAAWADHLNHLVEKHDATWRFDLTRNELLYLLSNERRAPSGAQIVPACQIHGGRVVGWNPDYNGPTNGMFWAPQAEPVPSGRIVDNNNIVPPKDAEL